MSPPSSAPDRATARRLGLPTFFTGRPCRRGHVAERSTGTKHCRECDRARDRVRYQNPERRAAQFAQAARWWRDNRGKKNAITARRRFWIKRATPAWADMGAIAEIYRTAASFGPGVMEVDHEIPLRGRLVCGLHVQNNLRIIPKGVNRKKANSYGTE